MVGQFLRSYNLLQYSPGGITGHPLWFKIFEGQGVNNVICESDSLEAIYAVSASTSYRRHVGAQLIQEIRRLAYVVGLVVFVQTLKMGNCYADYMAHVGAASSEDFDLWDIPTPKLKTLLLMDDGLSSQ